MYGGAKMNLAFALNSYNQAKVAKDLQKGDGYAAVKFALEQAIVSMEKLNSGVVEEEKEHHIERALSCIYFLQKCLDFENGGDLAKNLFKVYEYCRSQIISVTLNKSDQNLDSSIGFAKTVLEGWEGIK
ncbi:MAG: hypothetical protein CMO49_06150 [Verrucomicrobiales bacterium]|nr:hypothetical protein [Verrucomicrobiales bacterium]